MASAKKIRTIYSPVETARPLDGKSEGYLRRSPGPFCVLGGQNLVPSFPAPQGKDGMCVLKRGST
jgi:hypothetical protein